MKKIISSIYNVFVNKKNSNYDEGTSEIFYVKSKVISIGNICAGGTGKTPLTETIAKYLLEKEKIVTIAAKGYKGDFKSDLLVRDYKNLYSSVDECGDEMFMLAQNINIPIVVNSDKYKAAQYLDAKFSPNFIILDDGFQHRKLHRDLDIIILDKDSIYNPFILPQGLLREPIENIDRADVICVTEDLLSDENFNQIIKRYTTKNQLIVGLKTIIIGIYNTKKEKISINQPVMLLSGIGINSKFHKSCKDYGLTIKGIMEYKDHYKYTLNEIKSIAKIAVEDNIYNIITTEKDYVKLLPFINVFIQNNIKLYYLRIETEITYNKEKLFDKIMKLQNDRDN